MIFGNQFLLLVFVVTVVHSIYPEFDDHLHYKISWNEPLSEQEEEKVTLEKVVVKTPGNEEYQCFLPKSSPADSGTTDTFNGPSPEVLIADVLIGDAQKCSFRLEPYWTYELCHGQKITQFHEEKDGEGVVHKIEFVLGRMTKAEVFELLSNTKSVVKNRKLPTRTIDNKEMPYFGVEMGNGTPCDLKHGQPRKTTVLYVCHPTSNNEVMSIKEVTTCEYEAIVLTPFLCGNAAFIVKEKEIHNIQCHALPGSPSHPLSLVDYAAHPKRETGTAANQEKPSPRTYIKPPVDKTINTQFLKGKYCLIGGTGWWQYEFCNGKHIVQFHVEPSGKKTVIVVGRWIKKQHISYMKSNKLNARGKNHVTQHYTGGDICDLTGKPRSAQVMLICKEGSGQPLSIYMTENEPCKYTVGVESPILCPFVKSANELGLFE